MMNRRQRRAAQFALAVPMVMSHRMGRMMRAPYSAADQAEFARMVTEKMVAFNAAWIAMSVEAMRVQQRFLLAWWRASPGIFSKGMAPVQRRAIANARRLAR
jgi:hypothetical protein